MQACLPGPNPTGHAPCMLVLKSWQRAACPAGPFALLSDEKVRSRGHMSRTRTSYLPARARLHLEEKARTSTQCSTRQYASPCSPLHCFLFDCLQVPASHVCPFGLHPTFQTTLMRRPRAVSSGGLFCDSWEAVHHLLDASRMGSLGGGARLPSCMADFCPPDAASAVSTALTERQVPAGGPPWRNRHANGAPKPLYP